MINGLVRLGGYRCDRGHACMGSRQPHLHMTLHGKTSQARQSTTPALLPNLRPTEIHVPERPMSTAARSSRVAGSTPANRYRLSTCSSIGRPCRCSLRTRFLTLEKPKGSAHQFHTDCGSQRESWQGMSRQLGSCASRRVLRDRENCVTTACLRDACFLFRMDL